MSTPGAEREGPFFRITDLVYRVPGFGLGPLSLEVRKGQVLSILGPNGAGKTTLLRLISGLETPRSGRVTLGGKDLTSLPPHERGVGFVFQDLALFPHMTVRENIEYGLRVRGLDTRVAGERVQRLLREFRLEGYDHRLPRSLSGGERQRVAIARSLAPDPALLLLDEPLNSVDPEHRRLFQAELNSMLVKRGITVLHVTHDLEEGAYFSDRIAVLMNGSLAQVGDSAEVLERPADSRVAAFLGFNVWQEGTRWRASRPSRMILQEPSGSPETDAEVTSVGRTLKGLLLMARTPHGELLRVEVDNPGSWESSLRPGDSVKVVPEGTIELSR